MGGTMILRIEDTDCSGSSRERKIISSNRSNGAASRSTKASASEGLTPPYRQSERREYPLSNTPLQLVEAGWAYYAFDTAEELDALRRGGRRTRRGVRL